MECLVCVHCHFYQPPRENPWLEAVQSQESAHPYHDWNERITRECYAPNGASRILDGHGRVRKIVNNYSRISFNFGPTLLSWMQERMPYAYGRILQADKESQRLFSGHGSAIAQAYNHAILPLCNARDKRTQILWGIKDFQHRFGRDPEGMWLPETAADTETLQVLHDCGIKFTVLAPRQAGQLRMGKKSPWTELNGHGIDSRRSYACELPSGDTINLFFYDGVISQAVAFEKLLFSGETLAHRLLSRFDPKGDPAQLIHIATDGESYGHHHAHGDMALAYALEHIEQKKLARLTNYGEYLALHPPTQEVRIIDKTSWSCAHGVSRWDSNCGCNSTLHGNWTQAWRKPLREAFDWLRDDLAEEYEAEAGELLTDPWGARDEYVSVVLDRSASSLTHFWARQAIHQLSREEERQALRLLEMQRYLMLMYTSCGWFFDEATGPETVQVLQYAGRAVQLGEQLFGGDREEEFLKRLEMVRSNIAEFGTGRDIYRRFVHPAMLDLDGIAAHYAIASFFDGYQPTGAMYQYLVDLGRADTFENGKLKLSVGIARITSQITKAELKFSFAVLYRGGHDLRAGVRPLEAGDNFGGFVDEAASMVEQGKFDACAASIHEYFGQTYSSKSLFHDERKRIIHQIVDSTLGKINELYGIVYGDNVSLISFLREMNTPSPAILRVSAEFALGNEIRRSLTAEDPDLEKIRILAATATKDRVALSPSVKAAVGQRLDVLLDRWRGDPLQMKILSELESIVAILRLPPFEIDLWRAQNVYFDLLGTLETLGPLSLDGDWVKHFRSLGESLNIVVPETLAVAPHKTKPQARSRQIRVVEQPASQPEWLT